MALRVRTNVASLIAQRNLGESGDSLLRNVERLSSGLRINSAKDDPAGLAISVRMGAQIRGLSQAIRNTNDGISLTQTAESALADATDVVNRIRELAVQAASDTNTDDDRLNLQEEVDELVSELDRIAEDTEFNSTKPINGDFTGAQLQVGAKARQTVGIQLADARSSFVGRLAREEGAPVTVFPILSGDIEINGVALRGTEDADDSISAVKKSGSAIAISTVINEVSEFTGVEAIVGETTFEATDVAAGGVLDSGLGDFIEINGVAIDGITVNPADAGEVLRQEINAVSDQTGVTASINEFNRIELYAPDGRNIDVFTSTAAAAVVTGFNGGIADAVTTGATITLQSDEDITLDINFAGAAGAIGFPGPGTTIIGVSQENSIRTVDVTSRLGANRAIDISDAAIRQLTNARAKIGGLQNRLESTANNLTNTADNLTVAHSRIVDADFASEVASLARNNFLREAGTSVLAQANISNNLALSLLDTATP